MTTEVASADDKATPTTQDRLVFLFLHFVGHIVQVQLKDGVIYEGLCHAIAKEDFSVVLVHARLKQSRVHQQGNKLKTKPKPLLHIPAAEIVSLFALEVSFGGDKTHQEAGFFTDGDLAGRSQAGCERELQRCDFLTSGSMFNSLESDINVVTKGGSTAWDQFGVNQRLFGYRTTFDENLYTTHLDHKKLTADKIKNAERIAREIEQGLTDDHHLRGNIQYLMERNQAPERDYDEEELHSSVIRPEPKPSALDALSTGAPGKYVPPHKRGAAAAAKPEPALPPTQKPLPSSALSAEDVEKQLLAADSKVEAVHTGNKIKGGNLFFEDLGGPTSWADSVEDEERLEATHAPLAMPPADMRPSEEPKRPLEPADERGKAMPSGIQANEMTKSLDLDAPNSSPKQRIPQMEFNKWKREDGPSKTKPPALNRAAEIDQFKAWSLNMNAKLGKDEKKAGMESPSRSPDPAHPKAMSTGEGADMEDLDCPSTPGSVSSKSSALNPNAKEWKPIFGVPGSTKKAGSPVSSTHSASPNGVPPTQPTSNEAESGEAMQASEWRPPLKVPISQTVLSSLAGSLVQRLAMNEGASMSIGGDRQYSHQWVSSPLDQKDFVYYIDLESVQDELEALHQSSYSDHDMHMSSMMPGPDGRQYGGGYMNQSSYPMPQGQVQPSPHVPGGPGGALPPPGMGGPAPYGPGPYGSAYNSGYNSSNMGSGYPSSAAMPPPGSGAPANQNVGVPRMPGMVPPPPVGQPPHVPHMVDMSQGVHPPGGVGSHQRGAGGYYPPSSAASATGSVVPSSAPSWQQNPPQNMGVYAGYGDHRRSGQGNPPMHQHHHSQHQSHHHMVPAPGQMHQHHMHSHMHPHMHQQQLGSSASASQNPKILPPQNKKQDPNAMPGAQPGVHSMVQIDDPLKGRGTAPSGTPDAMRLGQRTAGQRYAPPSSHGRPTDPPSPQQDDAPKRQAAQGGKSMKGRQRKPDM